MTDTTRDILMAVKGTPKEIIFITPETSVAPDTTLRFIVDDSLESYICDPSTYVLFTWNDSPAVALTNSQTLVKSAGQTTDSYTLSINSYGDEVETTEPKSDEEVCANYGAGNIGSRRGSISSKSGTIIVKD